MKIKKISKRRKGPPFRRNEKDIAYISLLEKEVFMRNELLNKILDEISVLEQVDNLKTKCRVWVKEKEELEQTVQSMKEDMQEEYGSTISMALDKMSMLMNYFIILSGVVMTLWGCLSITMDKPSVWYIIGGVLAMALGIYSCIEERKWAAWDNI